MTPQLKYARIERERRFLLAHFPSDAAVVRVRRIMDRYLDGTRLRLRQQIEEGSATIFKLAQKIPAPAAGAQQGFITNMYLREEEFRVLAQLPGAEIRKTRYSVPPFGVDVFEGEHHGLVLAEIEFDSAGEADALKIPSFVVREVADDERFTGGRLARASREEMETWLRESGIHL